ncbi:MAG: nonstructural protein [Microvirus sp.]|nr:MAG: nonstructural protein [Microvirus sp.]
MLYLFCVRDSAVGAFAQPISFPSKGVAIRTFTDEVNRKDDANNIYRHPTDFELWYFGLFDPNSGEFDLSRPEMVCRGRDVSLTFYGE